MGISRPRDACPARALPLLYLGTAHVSLALAFVLAGLWPTAVAGFFYHPWMIALVHLVTLGWITFSILGAVYIVGPLALRTEMPVRRSDYAAWAAAVIGLIGMVGHFWIEEYPGMAWSAATVAAGVLFMTLRIVARVGAARIQPAVKLHIILACANLWLAAVMGVLLAVNRVRPFLPGFVVSNVFAHAHLAALGWAAMMVVGVAYRLLPMTFPSKMPSGRSMYASAILLETGGVGLFVALLLRSRWALAFGVLVTAGLGSFAAHVVWMARHPVPRPPGAAVPDFALLHAAGAGVSLACAAVVGLGLLALPAGPETLRVAAAYGTLGLVGFLAQMIAAMEARLLPMATWFWLYRAADYRVPPPSPHSMRNRRLQSVVFGSWTIGVPALAAGLLLESPQLVGIGAWALLAGVLAASADNLRMIVPAVCGRASAADRGITLPA
jgi:hypothetical protein